MGKIRIIYNRNLCIGAAACVAMDPKYFEMDGEGKAVLKGGKEISEGRFELIVDSNDASYHAKESCPVEVIKIEEIKEDKKEEKADD